MADSGSGGSGENPTEEKRGFSALFSSKLARHNPFKRANSTGSTSDDEDFERKKPSPSRREKFKSGLTSMMARVPTQRNSSSGDSFESHDAIEQLPPSDSAQSAAQASIVYPTVSPLGDIAAGSRAKTASPPPAVVVDQPVPQRPPQPAAGSTDEQGTAKPGDAAAAPVAAAAVTAPKADKTPALKKKREVVGGSVYGAPEIVLTGVKGDPDEVMKAFRTRGFVVHLSMLHEDTSPPSMTIVLAMGPKLLIKSAVERNLPTKARGEYTSGEVSQLCADAVQVIKRSQVEYREVIKFLPTDGLMSL